MNKFAKKDNRIKIIDKKNEGTGVTRNIGLNEASGDYIYFFDPDDYIVENTLYELYENITLNNSDFVLLKLLDLEKIQMKIDYSRPGFKLEDLFPNKNFNNFCFQLP